MKDFIRMALVLLVSSLILLVSVYSQIKVSYVGGEAYFVRDNVRQRITFGMDIKPGDTITTSKRSFVALIFDDGSVHKVTANSQYQIQNYRNNDNSRFQVFNIIKGKIFSFVSKTFKKSDIKFLTPTAVVGVRGTSFVTEVNGEGTTVYLVSGKVDLSAGRGGPAVPLDQGQKGKISRSGKIDKEPMQEQDYQEAAKDVPASLTEFKVLQDETTEDNRDQEQEKNLVRQYVDDSLDRIEDQRQEIFQNKNWDYQSEKVIGNYRISQVVKRLQDNQLSIINHTFNTAKGRQNSLDFKITFEKSIPGVAEATSGTALDAKQIDWKMSVSEGNQKDELFFSKDFLKGSQTASFNNVEGASVNSTGYIIKGSNIPVFTKINFQIDGGEYTFNFNHSYINADGSKISGVILNKDNATYERILSGDLDTQIEVQAILPYGKGNVLTEENNIFHIIILNNFIFPLFNSVTS